VQKYHSCRQIQIVIKVLYLFGLQKISYYYCLP